MEKKIQPTQEITVTLEPDGETFKIKRPKTALQLLHALGLEEETALVARDGQLLTPDRRVWPDDEIWVRKVGSRG